MTEKLNLIYAFQRITLLSVKALTHSIDKHLIHIEMPHEVDVISIFFPYDEEIEAPRA